MAAYGLPYMGSKGLYAPIIFRAIHQRIPDDAILIDPFCGGYSMSQYFQLNGVETISSDLDRYIVAFINEMIFGDVSEEDISKFISRDEFLSAVDDPDSLGVPDWYIGYIRSIWSFGSSLTNYIYGLPREPVARALHNLILHQEASLELENFTGVTMHVQQQIAGLASVRKRLSAFSKFNRDVPSQHIIRLFRVMKFQSSMREEVVSPRQHRVSNLSYIDAIENLPDSAVLYFDPPYTGTREYAEDGFNHQEFWELATELSSKHQVFVSEYVAPDHWSPILSFSRPNTFSSKTNSKKLSKAREHLFTLSRNS